MTRRFDVGGALGARPRLDGREVVGEPVRFYRRKVRGAAVCGLWLGGRALYDVAVYGPAGELVGVIDADGSSARQTYDELRRVLVAEDIRA